MPLYGQIAIHIIYPLWMLKDGSWRQVRFLRQLEETQFHSAECIRELQWRKVQLILRYAYAHCPWYQQKFRAAGIEPRDIRTPQDMLNLPILTKREIQHHLEDLKAKNFAKNNLIRDMTGGSTGSPLAFYYDRERLDTRQAAALRHNRWAGWNIGDKAALIWGATRDISNHDGPRYRIRNRLLKRELLLDASSLTEEKMFEFARRLEEYRPKIILGYANVLALFAGFVQTNKVSGIKPSGVVSSAEALLPEDRNLIESVFGCRVFNRYGCREVGIVASECEHHSGMHISAENLYVEFVRNGRHAEPREMGEILITDLLNFGMPLIRYKIGDAGSLAACACSCGRGLPLMETLTGRTTDFIVTPAGKIISGVALATYVITGIEGIMQVQLVQDRLNHLTVKVRKGKGFTSSSAHALKNKLIQFLGEQMEQKMEFVSNIPTEASGKYRFSISNVAPECIGARSTAVLPDKE